MCIINISQIQIMRALLTFLSLLLSAHSAAFTPRTCNSSQVLDTSDLQCYDCPYPDQVPNPRQATPTACLCKPGFYPALNNLCTSFGAATCTDAEYIPALGKDGSTATSLSGLSCQPCDGGAYQNQNGTGCTACPANMVFISGDGCTCSDSSMIATKLGCFPASYTSGLGNLAESSSAYYQTLKYLFPGCYHFLDLLSCSQLVNLCTYSLADTTASECRFFTAAPETQGYLYFSSVDPYYMPPGTFSKTSILNLKLISYLPTGNYVGEKTMSMTDVARCGMPSDNSIDLKIGNNIDFTCSYNFNYLLEMAAADTYTDYLYELLLQGADNKFYPVAVYLDGAPSATRRFFLQDTFTSSTTVKILTSFDLQVSMNTTGYLLEPVLRVGYTQLSVQDGVVTPDADKAQSISYSVRFKYDTSTFMRVFIALLIVVSVLALLQGLARTYIGYLNRESLFNFFFYFFKFWSLWVFYFLLCISGYWFLFSKTTQTLYIFVPTPDEPFYAIFYVVAGAMGFLRLVTVLIDKKDKLNMEVFMINWEKGQFKNSWREIFIINSLAEFYTHRTISMFWLLLVVMFWLVGLDWQAHSAEVTHTDLSTIYYFNPLNRILLYFLVASIFIIVGIVFKLLRRLSVIKWPYPFEDFVDYCNVTNISFFFMKKRSAQAHYIHASIPDRTEVTFKEINEAIRRGLNKNRSVANEVAFQDMQRMYTVYVCKDLEDKFNNMLKKIEDEEHDMNKNTTKAKNPKKNAMTPREEFVEKKLKPHLEMIAREGSNRNKTITQSLFRMPPVDLRDPSSLQNRNLVIFDDTQEVVTEVFPNGNEFEEIHTVMIVMLMFVLMTANVPVSAFLTYFVDEYMINGWISSSCRQRLEKMTRVKEGFML